MKISRKDAIKIFEIATDKDDPYWENVIDPWYDSKNDDWPTIYDVMEALGISKKEYNEATNAN